MNILLKNIDTITSDDKRLIKNANIGIKNGKIEFVNTSGESIRYFKADKVIDGKNKLVMPGLINSHTHGAMTIFRNFANDLALEEWLFNRIFPAEAKLTDEDVYWGTMLGIAEMIKSGTTAFADMYLQMENVANAVLESGIRANLSRSPLRFTNGIPVDETKDLYKYYKDWNGRDNGRIKVYVEVHSAYLFDKEQLIDAAKLAKELGTGIHIHILETKKEREDSIKRYGIDAAEICNECGIFDVPVIAAHCVHLSEENMYLFKTKGVNAIHNPTSNLKLGSGIARVPDMLDRGINVALGTDGAASNNNLDMFEEMHLASLIHKGVMQNPLLVNAYDVIKMATVNGAKAIGFDDEIGCIKEGMKADLIIIDTDKAHLCPVNDLISAVVYSVQSSDVDTVICDGNILMENRELKTIDEEKAKFKVKEIANRILAE